MGVRVPSLLVAFLLARALGAECSMPSPAADAIAKMPNALAGFALHRSQGLVYVNFGCLDEAHQSFEAALSDAGGEPDEDKQGTAQEWAQSLIDYTQALLDWHDGRAAQAKETLLRLSSPTEHPEVNSRAALALAQYLSDQPDDAVWNALRPALAVLGKNGFWEARFYLAIYGLNSGNAPARCAELEEELDDDLPVLQKLELEAILAEVFRRSGSRTQAKLLASQIEDEFGVKVLDPDLRLFFVRLCAGIWSVEARQGNPEGVLRYNDYLAAMNLMLAK